MPNLSNYKLRFFVSILAFIIFNLSFILSPSPAFAQSAGTALNSSNFNYSVNGQTTLEGSIGHAFFCMIVGVSPFNACVGYSLPKNGFSLPGIKLPGQQSNAGVLTYAQPMLMNQGQSTGGALGATASLMAGMYNNPPVSSSYYMADLAQGFGVPNAYAQSVGGSGDSILKPIIQLWQVTRNLAYLAFILVIITVGFMIMFRQKINPQTVVTVQQAIPSIVIGLILVTFSYFIASLIVDLTFLGMDLVTNLFIASGAANLFAINDINGLRNLAQTANFFELFKISAVNSFGTVFGGTVNQVTSSFGGGAAAIGLPGLVGLLGGLLVFGAPGALLGIAGAATAVLIVPTLISLILIFALLIQMIRLTFSLITAYVELLVLTIGGPLFIVMGSIPGRSGTVSNWVRGLLANALIFPAVFAGFLFAGVILASDNNSLVTLPLFGSLAPSFIKVLIAFGIILGLPSIPDMVKKAFKYQGPQGIANEAINGVNLGLTGSTIARGYAEGGNTLAYNRGWYSRPLSGIRDSNFVPRFIRRAIPNQLPQGVNRTPGRTPP